MVLTRKHMMELIDDDRIQKAIVEAERRTSGEVRVAIAHYFWGSVEKAADRCFERLGMTRTAQRNGILFFVVPSRRRFVVRGDAGIHEKVGPAFWSGVAEAVSKHFKTGDYTGGLVDGIGAVGEQLAAHFPHQGEKDENELPNAVDYGDA
jgi:uncharacterized membrane protein